MKTIQFYRVILSTASLATALISSAGAATVSWTNLNGGNWNVATNWSPNQVPGSADTALITAAGAYTVTLNTSPTVNSLTLGGSSGQQTLATAGNTLTWTNVGAINSNGVLDLNGGALAGSGLLTVSGQLAWTGGQINGGCTVTVATNGLLALAGGNGNNYAMFGAITNAGTVQLVSGYLQLYNSSSPGMLVNLPGGVVDLTADVSINNAGSALFVNEGTLVKSGGTGISTIVPAFINSGTVEANTGTISINGNGAAFNNGSVFNGAGQTSLNGSTVTLNGNLTSANLVLAGAYLAGTGTLSGVLTWTSGQLQPTLALMIPTNSVLTLAGLNGNSYTMFGAITNAGTVQLVSGNLQLYTASSPGLLVNLPSGIVELTADVSINNAGNALFVNEGTLVKSGGTGTSTIGTAFVNSGTVEASTGTISINGSGATFNNGSVFNGAGQTTLNGSTVTLNGSLISSNLVLAGAYLAGTGTLSGVLTWTSGQLQPTLALMIPTNSVLTLAGVNGNSYTVFGTITNMGTVQIVSGNLQLYSSGTPGVLVNLPGGMVELTADVSIVNAGNALFVNEGTLVKSGGTSTSTIGPAFINSGTVEANTGTISIYGGATFNTGSLFIGAGQTTLPGSTVTLNGSLISSNLVLAGANLDGTGTLNGVLTWTSGQLQPTCTLMIPANSVLTLAGVNGDSYTVYGTITNLGTVQVVSGNLQLYSSGTPGLLVNLPGGMVELTADVSILNAGNALFLNEGTLVKTGGTNTSTIGPNLINSATVEANTGTISIYGNGATFNTGSLFIGAGQTTLPGSTVTLNGSLTSSNLVWAGAQLAGTGTLSGVLTWTSGQINTTCALTIAPNGVLALAGVNGNSYTVYGTITNAGIVQLVSGNLQFYSSGTPGLLVNLPGGMVELTADVSILNAGSAQIVNEGTLVKTGGTNTSTIQPLLSNAGGSIGVESGTISLYNNNFAQNSGTFFVTLGGTNTGQAGELTGVNSATLGGLLTVDLTNGFVPATGSKFQILFSSSRSGTMAPLNVPSGLSVTYSNSGVYLTVTNTVALAPAITVQPTNTTTPYAGSAAFSVAATGMTPLSYQWSRNGTPLTDGGVISGSATANLALNGVTDDNAGSYSVIVTNAYGSVTSSNATLTVLNCTAPSSGIVAWWPGNGNALDIISGNNGVLSNGVAFAPAEVGLGFEFATNHAGVVVGNPTNLQLQAFTIEAWVQRASPSTATTDPTAVYGSGVLFSYGHAGYSFGMLSNGVFFLSQVDISDVTSAAAVTDTSLHHVAVTAASNGSVFFYVDGVPYPVSGSYGPTYSFSTPAAIGVRADNINANNNASFYGVINQMSVYNTALSSNQIAAIYGAGAAGKCLTAAAAIAGQPQSQSVVLGGTATFSVETTGLLPITNQWSLNGTNLADNGRISGSQSNVLTITNVQFSDAGTYLVTVSNSVGGTTSQPATLTVLRKTPIVTWSNAAAITYGTALNDTQLDASANVPGTFTYTPSAGTVLNAGSYLLMVVFTPNDTLDYNSVTSYASLTVMRAPLTFTASNASRAYGQSNPVFTGTIIGLQGLDNITGSYSCAAVPASAPGPYAIVPSLADSFGRLVNYSLTVNDGTLTVTPAPPPAIYSISPTTGSTNGNQTVTLMGTNFEVGATLSFGSAAATNVTVSSPTLLTATTPASGAGVVNVTIHNPDGNVASLTNAFTYGIPPIIQQQPLSQSVVLGSNVQFQVQAVGQGTLSYQWQFNGANLLNLGGISGVQTAALTISNLVLADAGSYRVVLSDAYGTLTSTSAVLTVLTPPTVTAPPSLAVGMGASASFAVTPGGSAPYSYQWYQGSTLLAGATSSALTFASVQTTNAGQYTVVVTNIVGAVTSSPPATLTVLGYCASAQAAQSSYPAGTTVPITLTTYNCGNQSAVSNSAAVLWIYNAGTSRTYPATTDNSGNTTVNFTPLAGEVGQVQYAAALPGLNNPAAQGSFTLLGMGQSAPSLTTVLTVGLPQTNVLTLSNLTSVVLSGLTANVIGAPANISAQVGVPGTLTGNGSVQATCVLEASGTTPSQSQFTIQFVTAAGVTNNYPVSALAVQLEPQVVATPPDLSGTMVGGGQTLVTFGLANLGGVASGSLQILLPTNTPWLSVVTAQPLASLAPGQTNLVTLALTPTNGLALGPYAGGIVVGGPNTALTVPFTFFCVSTQVGNLQVTAQDEFTLVSPGAPNLSNATVTVTDFLTGTNVASGVTGPSGTVVFSNLTSAYYNINVAATNHGSFGTTVLVPPNQTTNLNAFLPVDLVSYTWVVTPTEIPDDYEFTLTTTFQTQVPWPVVTITPGAINLCNYSGTNQIYLVITNNGLIAAQGLVLSFGTNADWSLVPLASNLGDLPAESSLVVPVLITQLGSSTSAASSIAAQLNWHVFTPTQTNYYTTPIFVYNANPNNCVISSVPVVNIQTSGSGGSGGGGGGGSGVGTPFAPYVAAPSYNFAPQVTGAIVDVTLQIDQRAVIERNAFKATLQLNNNAAVSISDLQVTINPVDASGNPATNLFDVLPPTLTGLNAVDGTGSMASGASGTASWTIIPANGAAPTGPTQFAIGGTLSYMLDGQQVVIPLFAVPITVMPSPILNVDYFLQHDVYSQDPFVSQYEPPIPFGLGIIVHNDGLGLCDDFTITSAQPQIIANSNGLLITFELIGSQAGTNQAVTPSLTMDLGAIQPQSAAAGVWLMTSTLEGAFINYSATFQEVNALGATNISLVNSVAIHEMNHIVRITVPSDDGIPDFLVNDTTNIDALPNNVYSSTGPVFPVTSLTNVNVSGTLSSSQSNVTATLAVPAGWVYMQFPDPSGGQKTIASVTRSDGVNLLVGPNVWQTPERVHMLPPQTQNLVHIFDYDSTGSYTITYGPTVTVPTVTTLEGVTTNPAFATLNCLVNPNNGNTTVYYQWGLTTNYTAVTPSVFLTELLNTPQDAAIGLEDLQPNTTYHFQAVAENSAGTSYGGDLSFTTPQVPLPIINQASNVTLSVGQSLAFVNYADAGVIYSLDPSDPVGCQITTNGIFTWTPSCDEGTTTNRIIIWATDLQYPTVSNSMTFDVAVGDCVKLSIGSAALQTGQSACVPVTLIHASVPLSDIQFALQFPSNRLDNWTISSTNIAVAAAILQSQSATQAQFSVGALSGRALQGPANIAELCFQAQGAHSGFLTLTMTNLQGTETNGTLAGATTGIPGQVTVVSLEPLLQLSRNTNNVVMLTLYGNPGSNYVIQSAPDLTGNDWQTAASLVQTNVVEVFVGSGASNPPVQFYRAYQQGP
jgi:hypothetical protein